MRLIDDEREAIYDAALAYGHAHFDDVAGVLSYENDSRDTFRIELLPGHCMATVVLLNVTFHSADEALAFFQPQAVQLSLFEVT
jgi:hypothetical protein